MTSLLVPGSLTETAAVNICLRALGEAPISNIATATQADVVQIISLLQEVIGEVQSMKWRFNTEFGYRLMPAGQLVWTDQPSGNTETLNVFEVPSNVVVADVQVSTLQSGFLYPDVVQRRAQYFQDPPTSGVFPMVLYDRAKNREGLNAAAYPYIGLNVTWFVPFTDMPYEAQLYCARKAARMAVDQIMNSSEISDRVKTDEGFAYRTLRRSYGIMDSYNMLRNVNGWRWTGMRPTVNVGFIDNRGQQLSVPAPTEPTLPALSLSPSAPTHSISPSGTATETWTLTNTSSAGGPTGTYQAIALVDGVEVVSAIVSPAGPFQLAPGASQTINVTYTVGANAGTGTVTLMIINGTVTDATSVLTVTIT